MIRITAIIFVVVLAIGILLRRCPSESGGTPEFMRELDEAKELQESVEKFRSENKLREAIPLAERSLAIMEKILGPADPVVAVRLSDLASLHVGLGAYAEAERLLARAGGIAEKAMQPSDPKRAAILGNLGYVYARLGMREKAEPLLLKTLQFREQQGPKSLDLARSLEQLAAFYGRQGDGAHAESLAIRALKMREELEGPDAPRVGNSLEILGEIYKDQGAFKQAELVLTRAVGILDRSNVSAMDAATAIGTLAMNYEYQLKPEKAEPLYERALEISQKALPSNHPEVLGAMNNLGIHYYFRGAYDKAEPLLRRVLELRNEVLSATDPELAVSLNNLALIYDAQELYQRAEPLLLRAHGIWETTLGHTHPTVATSLDNLGVFYWRSGAYAHARDLLSRAAEIHEQQLRLELPRLPERRQQPLVNLVLNETDGIVSMHADAMPNNRDMLELAFTTVLRRKGRVLDALAEREATAVTRFSPAMRAKLDQLDRARNEYIERLYTPTNTSAASDSSSLATARSRIDQLEASLGSTDDQFRVQAEQVTLAKVQAVLPSDAALVEFFEYSRFDFAHLGQPWRENRYVAFLLSSSGPPKSVALGEAAPIQAAVESLLAKINSRVDPVTPELQRLDALVLAPIREQLGDVSHLILAPDSWLNLVPFEALVDASGQYALDRYLVSYLTSGRDLLRMTKQRVPRSPAVIMAGPDYGPIPFKAPPETMWFLPLPGARGEARDLQMYFPAAPLTGRNATASLLKSLVGPAMIHIATHAFYGRPPDSLRLQPMAAQLPASRGMFVALARAAQDNDLDRAGLAMAGANQGATGIVTAREIAGLDWWGTELVVLSACQTGVGAPKPGEGVYGLRRALVLAGVASQVVSLWAVDDNSTRLLMSDFYRELARGTGRAEALRQAKLRSMKNHSHPRDWAAFIPVGDWRPLEEHTIRHGRTNNGHTGS